MDKETKDIVANNASYDPDAAELLKALEDEDDDDYEPAQTTSQANRSIVNILNSSTNLESLATVPSLPVIPTPLAAVSTELASSTELSHLSSSDDRIIRSTVASDSSKAPNVTQPLSPAPEPVSVESSSQPEQTTEDVVPETQETTEPSADNADESRDPAGLNKNAIKPYEKPTETKVKLSIKRAEDAEKASAKKEDKPAKEETSDSDASQQHSANAKKPPVPPPMPTPSMSSAGRVLREGEMIITQDMLNDLLPGGKNDEGRDLAAFKFTDNNWYSQVFNEDYFRTVPKSSPRQTAREAKFIIDRLGIESGARVLDLCCGYGRHTLLLAQKGFDMVGLDLSMVMLKKALADAQANGQAIKFVHGDMRKLSFKAIFDAIYNVQTSFGYFDDQSNFRVLQGIFNALKPGGVFLIETVNRDFIINDLPLRLWWKGIDCTLLEEIDCEVPSGLLKVQRSFVFDDNSRAPWEQKIQIRLYTANEMKALLTRAGFKVVELSGDYSLPGAYFGATSPKNIFVAEKPLK